ncbi:MAG: hypothetical protein OXG29_10200 [Gammaproteobacteria bacterium]|nr:hypothetical protein [Gammaproteobacteria bacterium]
MAIMIGRIVEMHNNVLATISVDGDSVSYRALQCLGRSGVDSEDVYAAEPLRKGDQVLLCEVPYWISRPDMHAEDFVSHIILGLLPPSEVKSIPAELLE